MFMIVFSARHLRYFDWISFLIMIALAGIGLIFIFSATYCPEQPYSLFFKKQFIGIITGIVIYLVCCFIDYLIFLFNYVLVCWIIKKIFFYFFLHYVNWSASIMAFYVKTIST